MANYSAPAVHFPARLSGWVTVVLFLVLLLGAVAASLYAFQTSSQPVLQSISSWRFGVIATSWLFAAWCVGHFLYQLKPGELYWDGFSWHWMPAGQANQVGRVSLRFDGQRSLLLKFESSLGVVQWLCLMQSFAPTHWHALRRAVYSRADSNLIPLLNPPD